MSRLLIQNTFIAGLQVIQRMQIGDERGFFSRLYCDEELAIAGWRKKVAQINHTFTKKAGTIRGFHFQHPPYTEMKLVTCLRGLVWDVAVDLRNDSPTFMRWHAEELSSVNQRSLLIPEGFAHGFQTLTDDCELLYLHSTAYKPEAEDGINPIDPLLSITWPMPITELSNKDAKQKMMDSQFKGIKL